MTLSGATLRIARATARLSEVTAFYVDGLGFEVLAAFDDHAGFDGVVLGSRNAPYHLEFTHERGSTAPPIPHPETLLVFYVPGPDAWRAAVARLKAIGAEPCSSHNPYWDLQGLTFEDPDGFRVVLQQAAWPL
jgi:catechol 2,3-dioxygenase-like lactoylglutathione lyase family enzyme